MISKTLFNSLFPTKGLNPNKFNLVRHRDELIAAMNEILPEYGIDNYFRICAFWAACGIESDYFKTTTEYASGAAYEGRAGLGNFFSGDGKKFKGRTLIQTTGRYNVWRVVCRFVKKLTGKDFSKDERKYKNFFTYLHSQDYQKLISEADRLGVNFLAYPEKLGQIETAVEAACIFWEENKLNFYADRGRFKELNGIINRGDKDKEPLHWSKRNALYITCLVTVPKNFKFDQPVVASNKVENQATDVSTSPIVAVENNSPESLAVPPTVIEPKKDDSFLADAFDKNVSSEDVKTVARSAAPRILVKFARPFLMLYAALEAGSVGAWLGVIAGLVVIALLIYWHRDDLKKIWQSLKNKFLQ